LEIVPSPAFQADRTVFATTFEGIQTRQAEPGLAEPATAWTTSDEGGRWAPIGRFSALAISPRFTEDDRLLAFGYLGPTFFISHDRGRSWQRRGRLPAGETQGPFATRLWVLPASEASPETLIALATISSGIGGGPHWPESGARLYRSLDEGATWQETWPGTDVPSAVSAVPSKRIHLFGPIRSEVTAPMWLLDVDGRKLLRSTDHGGTWAEVHVAGTLHDPYRDIVHIVAIEPSGEMWISAWTDDRYERIQTHVEELLPGPPPPADRG
jgi:hypothetical protein